MTFSLRACIFGCVVFAWSAVLALLSFAAVAQPGSTRYHVELHPDGQPPVKIHVEEMGRGPPILLLHGLGGSSYSWCSSRRALPRRIA